MPEGVEVRISTDYVKFLKGKELKDIQILQQNHVVKKCDPLSYHDIKLVDIFNKGKFIFMQFSNDSYIEIHFNMGGSFGFKPHKHSVVAFNFKDITLFYNDIRKFGHVNTLNKEQFQTKYKQLGEDIMNCQNEDLLEFIPNILKHRNKPIKQVLMNQNIIGGIGNIYAIEGLYISKILPNRLVRTLTEEEILYILINTRNFMWKSYNTKGMTVKSFKLPDGHEAQSAQLLQIYGKKYCPCNNKLMTEIIGGRNTVYCPTCQL